MKERDWLFYQDVEDLPEDFPDITEEDPGPSPFYLELQSILKSHFAEFGDYEDSIFITMAHNLAFDQAHEFPNAWSTDSVLKDLAILKTRLTEARKIWQELPYPIHDALRHGALQESGLLSPDSRIRDKRIDFMKQLARTKPWRVFLSSSELFSKFDHFLVLIDYANDTAKLGKPEGKLDLEALRLVGATAKLCQRNLGTIEVPKAMNEAGPFYRLLCDLFDLYEIEVLPTSAFRSWKRNVGDRT